MTHRGCWQLHPVTDYFFPILEFYPRPFPAFLRERSVLGWRRSNIFPVPSNGVGALSDAAVEVLIHALLPHARLFRLACSCIPSTRFLPPPLRSLLRTLHSHLFPLFPMPRYIALLLHDTHTHTWCTAITTITWINVNLENVFIICCHVTIIYDSFYVFVYIFFITFFWVM